MAEKRPPRRRSWLARLFRRKRPTTFARCLAVHVHYAGKKGEMSS